MAYSKMSVTIPDEIYKGVKELASRKKIKLSHIVTEALTVELRKVKEKTFVQQINKVFEDPETAEEQRLMAESIADNTDTEELPW